jgi:hypothetical protein
MRAPEDSEQTGPVPWSVPEAIGFLFDGAVEVGGPSRTFEGTGGLSLRFDRRGVEVTGPQPGEHHLVAWALVTRVTLGGAQADPSGGFVVPIEIASRGGISRYLIPSLHPRSVQIDALDRQLVSWSQAEAMAAPVHPLPASSLPGRPFVPAPYPMPPISDGVPSGFGRPSRVRPRRVRRRATLVAAVALLVTGSGLAFGLSIAGSGRQTATPDAIPRLSPDQLLADQLMLTRNDLPQGWTVNTGGSGRSQQVQHAEVTITRAFARCMGITEQQGAVVLGGQAGDQTAQSSSPIFVAPASAARPGFAFELQTAASIVRSHGDEQHDFALFAKPQYPQCAATAVASELQVGANTASGHDDQPGRATPSVVALPAPAGEQLSGLRATFTVSDRSTPVPVEVEAVSLGSDRIEATLQAFAIGGPIPSDILAASVAVFEQRVAGNGKSALVGSTAPGRSAGQGPTRPPGSGTV